MKRLQATSDKRQAGHRQSYKNLLVWQIGNELVLLVYRITKKFPPEERYGLTSQLRRATLSVVLNIIEGHARRNDGDFRRFLDIALGSLIEVEYLLELSRELSYIDEVSFQQLVGLREQCGRLLWSFRMKLQ